MNIALVNNHYQLGGAETVVRQLHNGYRNLGHSSKLYVTEGKGWPRRIGVRPLYPRILAKLDTSRFRSLTQKWAPRTQWTNRAFLKLAQSEAEVIHVHSYHGLYASLESFVAVAQAKPVVWTFHRFWGVTGGCDHPGQCKRYLAACGECPRVSEWPLNGNDDTAAQLEKKRLLLAPAPITIIAPSQHLAQTVRESLVGRSWRIEVIPNGVDPDEFGPRPTDPALLRTQLGLDPRCPVVLAVNRSFRDGVKGGAILADAIPRLDHKTCQVVLVGGEADWMRQRLLDSGFPAEKCLSLGYIKDRKQLARLLQASDIFLYASPGENFPCATIEAMAAGCAVVSTPTDGVLEQLQHGQEGWLSGDFSGSSLAELARLTLTNPTRLREVGTAARARIIREFSEATMVKRHLALYSELVGDRKS